MIQLMKLDTTSFNEVILLLPRILESKENILLLFKKDDPVLTSAIVSTFKEKPYKAKNEWRQRGLYNVHMFSLR